MSTEKQIAANHRNAQSSTGPRTPEGKARSSLNAVKHGLTAAQILIPSESADDFESHAASFRDRFAPIDSVESFLVDQMIVAAWRLRRTRFLESKIYAQRAFEVDRHQKEREEELTDAADHIVTGYRRECSGTNSLENISRQETRIERAFYRAMHELNRLRNPKGKTPSKPILQNEPNSGAGRGAGDRGAGLQPAAVAFTKTRKRVAAESSPDRGADEAVRPKKGRWRSSSCVITSEGELSGSGGPNLLKPAGSGGRLSGYRESALLWTWQAEKTRWGIATLC